MRVEAGGLPRRLRSLGAAGGPAHAAREAVRAHVHEEHLPLLGAEQKGLVMGLPADAETCRREMLVYFHYLGMFWKVLSTRN